MLSSKISISIPTYNRGKYLQEALDSIDQQTYRDFEVVISHGCLLVDTLKIKNIIYKYSSKIFYA